MNLHEYQSKGLLKNLGIRVPEGIMVENIPDALDAAVRIRDLTGSEIIAVKAQIHAGGRGKGGGIKIAKSLAEVEPIAKDILGKQLITPQTGPQGKKVRKLLIEQNIYYPGSSKPSEIYLSILLNRSTSRYMIMYSPHGGVNIEEIAAQSPQDIFIEQIDPISGLQPFQCRRIAYNLGLTGQAYKNMLKFIPILYNAYTYYDCTLLEINPLLKTSDDKILVADTKMIIDNNALYRQPLIADMHDVLEEDPLEIEASRHKLNYIKLDGNVGCMVNGAGLAMATMDLIKISGGNPANFLDVGGSASSNRVEEAFRIILKDKNVKVILVNIFGGIVRCDRVARGIVDACRSIGQIDLPVIIRLQGTNAAEARDIIDSSGLDVKSALLLGDAASLVAEVLK